MSEKEKMEDAKAHFEWWITSLLLTGIGLGVILGIVISEAVTQASPTMPSFCIMLGGFIFSMFFFVATYIFLRKFIKSGLKMRIE